MIYLGKEKEDKARQYSQNYKKLLDIVEEITTINMTLLKKKGLPVTRNQAARTYDCRVYYQVILIFLRNSTGFNP